MILQGANGNLSASNLWILSSDLSGWRSPRRQKPWGWVTCETKPSSCDFFEWYGYFVHSWILQKGLKFEPPKITKNRPGGLKFDTLGGSRFIHLWCKIQKDLKILQMNLICFWEASPKRTGSRKGQKGEKSKSEAVLWQKNRIIIYYIYI